MPEPDFKPDILFQLTHTKQARALLECVPAAMIAIDEQGIVHAFSKSAEEMFGYAEDQVVGQDVSMLMSTALKDHHGGYVDRYLETGDRRAIGTPRVVQARDSDGFVFPISVTVSEVPLEDSRCFVAFMRPVGADESNWRQMKEMLAELAHASRISAMGALATAIAHELNQPLTSIANYAEGLRNILAKRTDIEGSEEYVRILENCSSQAVRAGQLIHRLREFIKGGEAHREAVAVEKLVDDSVGLALINGFKRAVRIDSAIPDNLPKVEVDALQGQQVLFNIIRNAFEAMDAEHTLGNVLKISARPADAGFVEICVEDSGPGIDADVSDAAFDSFVTTKGAGMGVGLAICRQIVESHGGRIWADRSDDLGGAAIHFTLPVAHPATEAEG